MEENTVPAKVTAVVNGETISIEFNALFFFIRDDRETLITLSRDRWPAFKAAVLACAKSDNDQGHPT